MTCHLPGFATGDGRSLSIGQGATGLGPARVHPGGAFIPRNAPPAFNLFANKHALLGRAGGDRRPGGELTDAGEPAASRPHMAARSSSGASALPLFPVLSREEMRAASGNELADIKDKQPQQVWKALMARLGKIPEYRRHVRGGVSGHAVRADELRPRQQRHRRVPHRPVRLQRFAVGPIPRRQRRRDDRAAAPGREGLHERALLDLPQRAGVHRQQVPQRRRGAVRPGRRRRRRTARTISAGCG